MVSVAENLSAATERVIDRSRDANHETLYSTPEIDGGVSFQQKMHMVHLHAEVQDPEGHTGRAREGGADRTEDVGVTQRRQSLAGA